MAASSARAATCVKVVVAAEDGPGYAAGVRDGDCIERYGEVVPAAPRDIVQAMMKATAPSVVVIIRAKKRLTLQLPSGKLGLSLESKQLETIEVEEGPAAPTTKSLIPPARPASEPLTFPAQLGNGGAAIFVRVQPTLLQGLVARLNKNLSAGLPPEAAGGLAAAQVLSEAQKIGIDTTRPAYAALLAPSGLKGLEKSMPIFCASLNT